MANKDNVVRNKIISVFLVWAAFAFLYYTLQTGNESLVWGGLGVMALASVFMYTKN